MVTRRPRWTVAVPYIRGMLREETRRYVLLQDPQAMWCEIPRNSPTSYAALLLYLWEQPGDTIIVEQDVVPPNGALGELLRCPSGWCTYPMFHGEVVHDDLLGVAKFSAALKRLVPHAMEAALLGGVGAHAWPNWRSLDRLWSRWCRHRDYAPCVHLPRAVHLKYPEPPRMQETPGALPHPGVSSDGSFDGS